MSFAEPTARGRDRDQARSELDLLNRELKYS